MRRHSARLEPLRAWLDVCSELADQEAHRAMLAAMRDARLDKTRSNAEFVGSWDKEAEEVSYS